MDKRPAHRSKNYTGKIPEAFVNQIPPNLNRIETGAPLLIETINTVDDWAALAADWKQLLKRNHQNTPFLTYEFQRAWWQHLGGGEWQDAHLHILAGRDEDGRLLGIAPLFRARDAQGVDALRFIGSHEIADFLDFIAQPEDLEGFIQAVFAHLQDAEVSLWQRLDLYNLVDGSASQPILEKAAQDRGWSYDLETLQPSPYIRVPESLDAYIENLASKQAHELRRKLRRAGRNPEPLTLEIIAERAWLPAALEDFFALMTQEAQKARFLTPAMRAQMETIALTAFDGGWLQLAFLKCGSRRIAGYLNFDYDSCIWAYNAGFNSEDASLSPGWLIMAEMMRWSAEHGRRIFDLMRGGEEYKYRFGAVDRFVQRVVITRM
jgi:CelD/BcsL family acetyltransferase involved in cellulose biosynthesis